MSARLIRRVLIAQGLAGSHPAALELALRLAAQHQAELAQLIIEDLELLRAAALPAAIEILRHSAEPRPLQSSELAGSARAQAETLRRALHAHRHVKWSIQILPGTFPATPAGHLEPDELLILTRPPRSAWPADAHTAPVLLVYADQAGRERLESLAAGLLNHDPAGSARHLEIVPRPDPALLHRALRRHRPGLVLAAADPALLRDEVLRELLEEADCPVVLLR